MTELENKQRDMLGSALRVIESFRPLADAARALMEYPVPAHQCPGFDCATCPPRGDLERAIESIADMLADADAEAGVSQARKTEDG